MGICSSTVITINLDRTSLFYFTGETVSGTVNLNIPDGKLEADEIFVQLTGEIGYTTTRFTSSRTHRREKRTEYHHIPFYTTKFSFARPEPGQKELIYNQGQYSWPFHFQLIDDLPPTINQPQIYPHVRYYLQVIIDKSWYKPNTREVKYLTIYPHVNLLKNPQYLLSTQFGNQNRKEIILKGTLNKLGYVIGEIININLEIENLQEILIQHIDVSMFQAYRIGRTARGFSIFQTTIPNIVNTKVQYIKETFSIAMPSMTMPPSYRYEGVTHRRTLVHIHYFIRLAVKVEGIFTNFNVDIPITLGTEPIPDFDRLQSFNPLMVSYSSNPAPSMFNDDDSTHDSDSIVQNVQ